MNDIMKKIYNQPTLDVVRVNTNDVIATSGERSLSIGSDLESGTIEAGAAGRFRDWDAGY